MLAVTSALLAACAPRIDRSRQLLDHLNFHGVHGVSEDDLRGHIATQPIDRFLGVRLPWADPQYYDETTFRRDLDRIERYYYAHGYYSAAVAGTRVAPHSSGREVDVDVTVREGEPTRVASLWLSGCEPESIDPRARWRVEPHACARIRESMQLQPGGVFTEQAFDADRTLIADLLKDEGHAAARVQPQATIDPMLHRAYVVFVLEPGPPARFGDIFMHEGSDEPAQQRGPLPRSRYSAAVLIHATAIRPGSPYSRSVLADAQRRLFDIGVFGIVRINEEPHLCDGRNRCDAARDPDDPNSYVRVDLQIYVSPTRPYRLRAGFGAEADQSRSDIHLLASFDHNRVPFFGRMARYRIDESPLVFLPFSFSSNGSQTLDPGNSLTQEFRIPEVWQGGTLIATLGWDIGPDPINPNLVHRSSVRGGFGALMHFSRQWIGSTWLRSTRLDYYNPDPTLRFDPVFDDVYARPAHAHNDANQPPPDSWGQTYTYLEQQVTFDNRDSVVQTRRGFYASLLNQESVAIEPISSYTFLRTSLDLRGYVPIGSHIVWAVRAYAGLATGFGDPSGSGFVNGWPVPNELRFYSGGANSNRGYAYNQIGWRVAAPQPIEPGGRIAETQSCYQRAPGDTGVCDTTGTRPQANRFINVGGLGAWEFSTELRYYAGSFGGVLFFDASDVLGWTPPGGNDNPAPPRRPIMLPDNPTLPASPAPSWSAIGFDPHPSAGIGLRYSSPIGIVRLDLGIRLDELNCIGRQPDAAHLYLGATTGTYATQVASQSGSDGMAPWYFATSRPQCTFLSPSIQLPLALNFAIGEAF